jgi:hypothetical protein
MKRRKISMESYPATYTTLINWKYKKEWNNGKCEMENYDEFDISWELHLKLDLMDFYPQF